VHAKTFQETIPIPAATESRDFGIVDEVELCDSRRDVSKRISTEAEERLQRDAIIKLEDSFDMVINAAE